MKCVHFLYLTHWFDWSLRIEQLPKLYRFSNDYNISHTATKYSENITEKFCWNEAILSKYFKN